MNKDLEKFRELLLTDTEFQKKLQAASEAYTGDQTEEAVFNNVLVPVASEYGISATFDEFKAYMENLNSDTEMSKEELSQVAGGTKGYGAAACAGIGAGWAVNSDTGCWWIGAGSSHYACFGEGQGT